MTYLLVLITLVLSVLRILGVKSIAYQAAAHLFVGGLFGAWLINKDKMNIFLFGFLTVVEIVCFIYFKHFNGL